LINIEKAVPILINGFDVFILKYQEFKHQLLLYKVKIQCFM